MSLIPRGLNNPMCLTGTPLEDRIDDAGLWVKREDMSCPAGPNFSKTRGVWAHVSARNEEVLGVLDTSHSQGGWAVARACHLLGRKCVVYYPETVADRRTQAGVRLQQQKAADLGAELVPLQAGRSAILYHQAKKLVVERGGYMMPNALKLQESVEETALELGRTGLPDVGVALVSASSATLAAGVLRGLAAIRWRGRLVIHLGYSRSPGAVIAYVNKMAGGGEGVSRIVLDVVDEGYAYQDKARFAVDPGFPCNPYYDLKALSWWLRDGRRQYKKALFWNIG